MKTLAKFLCVLTLAVFSANYSYAGGCNIDNTCSAGQFGAVCPTSLPDATVNNSYFESVTLAFPTGVSIAGFTATISNVDVNVVGLPDGMSFFCSDASCSYDPANDPLACVGISGTPCDNGGDYTIGIEFFFTATVPVIGTITLPIPVTYDVDLELLSPVDPLDIDFASRFLCPSGAGSSIDLVATPGYDSYSWSTSATDSNITVTSPDTYSVTAEVTAGCSVTESVVVENLDAQVDQASFNVCPSQLISLNASGGDSFSWSPTTGLSDANIANPIIAEGLTSDITYTVTVTNGNCSDTEQVTITIDQTCTPECDDFDLEAGTCDGDADFGSFCPEVLDPIDAGVDYDGDITLVFPDNVTLADIVGQPIPIPGIPTDFDVAYVDITGVSGLPDGLEWTCDQYGNNCRYFPPLFPNGSSRAGINICGTTCDPADTYTLQVQVTSQFDVEQNIIDFINGLPAIVQGLLPIEIPFTGAFDFTYEVDVDVEFQNAISITPMTDTVFASAGDTVTLSGAGGFASYEWGTGETTSSIDVTSGGTYCLTVTDNNGCEQTMCRIVDYISSVALIEDIDRSLTIYPNPSQGFFNVAFEASETDVLSLEVYNIQGQLVSQQEVIPSVGTNNFSFDLSNSAKGVYMVRIASDAGVVNKRVSVL